MPPVRKSSSELGCTCTLPNSRVDGVEARWRGSSTPSSRSRNGVNLASMAWGARHLISTQLFTQCSKAKRSVPKSGPDRRHGPRCSLLNSAIFAGNRSGAMSRLTCVEIEFRAPHAIDATLPPYLRLLDGVQVDFHTGANPQRRRRAGATDTRNRPRGTCAGVEQVRYDSPLPSTVRRRP